MAVRIKKIAYALPQGVVTSEQAAASTGLSADIRKTKLGIESVHVAEANESPSDLATRAVNQLFQESQFEKSSIEFLILVTQNPDYRLPATACLVQHKAELPKNLLAYDVNQGCSGFVIALAQAKGLIASGLAKRGLIVTTEVYNRVINPSDKDTFGLFGDAATAVLVEADERSQSGIQSFFFGTDGSGAEQLIVKTGGAAKPARSSGPDDYLYMNGRAIFEFVCKKIPTEITTYLNSMNLTVADIDHWIFHQANRFMNEKLCSLMGIPTEKAFFDISDIGNTVSCTIPIAMERARAAKAIRGKKVMLVGFGVGLSWAGCLYELSDSGDW